MINPITTATSYIWHENDMSARAVQLKDKLNNDILLGKTATSKEHHLEQVANKMVDDSNKDPFWINSINSVADISRHNYVFVGKVV